ncbi:MAG: hypothetical protein WCF13_07540, partial [Stellaceae bacterium]
MSGRAIENPPFRRCFYHSMMAATCGICEDRAAILYLPQNRRAPAAIPPPKPTPEPMITALLILAGTYLVMGLGRLPASRLDRTGAALLGASLMV